jgi:hypothetical protein
MQELPVAVKEHPAKTTCEHGKPDREAGVWLSWK